MSGSAVKKNGNRINSLKGPLRFLLLGQFLVLLGAADPGVSAGLAPKRSRSAPVPEMPADPELSPRRTHAGPVIHSLDYPEIPLLEHYLTLYSSPNHRPWLNTVRRRSLLYLDKIRRTIEYWGVPWEVAYLPAVESAFLPHAVSASGAAGIWQFMANSIGPYNMTIDEWRDDRKDFWKATDGAIQKLKYNYDVLGDWYLALAAYNCGLGRVQRAVAQSGIKDFWKLSEKGLLPSQTIHYVPRLMAVSHILGYPGRWNLELSWERPVKWVTIPLDKPVDLRLLAREAEIPLELLTQGNAELRYLVSPPAEYQLKVPEEYSDSIREILAGKENLMRFYIHRIQSGDTFSALARHYGVPVTMIERHNPNLKANLLRIGDTVVIPAYREVSPYKGSPAGGSGRSSGASGPLGTSEPSGTSGPSGASGGPRNYTGIYRVEAGDTLWAISRKYGISPGELADNNGISLEKVLLPGTILQVPETPAAGAAPGGAP